MPPTRRATMYLLAALILATQSVTPTPAQQPTPEPPASTGTVIGVLAADDTRLPIRFAEISLVPNPPDTKPSAAPEASQSERSHTIQVVTGSSGMDGSFRLDGVPAGDYLVAALKPGYVTPGVPGMLAAISLTEDQLKPIIATLPSVHIGPGQTVTINLTLHRGAVIAGRVQFADGSPAIATGISCEQTDSVLFHPELRGKVATPPPARPQLLRR